MGRRMSSTPPSRRTTSSRDGTLEVTAGGVLTGDTGTFGVPATVQVQRGGTLNVTGGTITSQAAGGGFIGPVSVQGGGVTVSSGAVSSNGGSATIMMNGAGSRVTISNGTITGAGSGILLVGQDGENTLNVTGGTITGGYGSTAGSPAITMMQNDSTGSNTVTISGGTLTGGGGGVAGATAIGMNDQGSLTISGGTIGSAAGGAVVLNQHDGGTLFYVSITGGTIIGGSGPPAVNMTVPVSAVGVTISGGTFSGSWLLNSGIAVVQGTNLVFANRVLTGTLARGQSIDVPVTKQQAAQLDLQTPG